MELYLVRHTETQLNSKETCYGHLDVELQDNYLEQAKSIRDQLKGVKFDQVYSSPLKRCSLLAEYIQPKFLTDHRLKEMHFGDWEGKNWQEINQSDLDFWMNNYIKEKAGGGESLEDLSERVEAFYNECITPMEKKNNRVLIVAHGGPIRCLISKFKKTPLSAMFDYKVEFGQIIKLYT